MVKPNLHPGIQKQVHEAIASEDETVMDNLHVVRTKFKFALATLLKEDGILAIPTVPGATPRLHMDGVPLEDFWARAFSLLSITSMSGFCKASIPLDTRCGVLIPVLPLS
ncbi:amidase 1 [Hordeum vulgare]|nr:amidase 1 [Hordeum vulgare]